MYECKTCRQLLDPGEFDFNMSTRKRYRECKVCRHTRLAKGHQREADLLLAARRRRREESIERARLCRAAYDRGESDA